MDIMDKDKEEEKKRKQEEEKKKQKKEEKQKKRVKIAWIILFASLSIISLLFFFHFFPPKISLSMPDIPKVGIGETSPFFLFIFIFFVPFWIARVWLEISGKYDEKKAWCVTVNMIAIFTLLIAILIFLLEAITPGWWSNIISSSTGRSLLISLIPLFVLIYILPGTGAGAVKWGKKLAFVLGLLIVIGLLITAISGPSKANYQGNLPSSIPKLSGPTLIVERVITFNQRVYTLATNLPSGKYKMTASGVHRQMVVNSDGTTKLINVPPEGIMRRYAYEHILPLYGKPNNHFGAITVHLGGEEIYAGRQIIFTTDCPTVKVGINIRDGGPGDFIHNEGAIRISLYRIS